MLLDEDAPLSVPGGVSISIILQGLGQLQNRYPDNEWVEIIGNADTTLFMGCTDDITARMISDRAGEITVAYSTDAEVYNKMQLAKWAPQYRESHSVGKRKLLTVDEVLRLPRRSGADHSARPEDIESRKI